MASQELFDQGWHDPVIEKMPECFIIEESGGDLQIRLRERGRLGGLGRSPRDDLPSRHASDRWIPADKPLE
jgi:hypothetical protein